MPARTRVLVGLAVCLGVASLAGCRRGPAPVIPFPAVTRIYYDNTGGVADSLRQVLRDEAEFHRVWQQATSGQPQPPRPPMIDFARDMVIVAAAGRLTADDAIRVDSVAVSREMTAAGRMEETLNVFVSLWLACRRFEIEGFPLEIVRLRRFDGLVRFHDQRQQADCLQAIRSTRPGW